MTLRRILVLGGTGVFGKRLARHLMSFSGIELFVSSRSQKKAEAFARDLSSSHSNICNGVKLEHGKDFAKGLRKIQPFAVVDCTGPFQDADYSTAKAVLEANAHLIDLADARGYLAGATDELDLPAKASGVAALCGASSTPTLSACVVRHLTRSWQRVESIDLCITPGGKSEVGRAVIEAILSYAGRDIPCWENGGISQTKGWVGGKQLRMPELGLRRVAPVETYDAEYLGPRHAVGERVTFSAGLESRIEQVGIETLAALRARGLCPDPRFLIPSLLQLRKITRIPTSDRGGMLVECSGVDANGEAVTKSWSLVARQDHGPFVPILPAAAALAKLLTHEVSPGAYIADQQLDLTDIAIQMNPYDISTATY